MLDVGGGAWGVVLDYLAVDKFRDDPDVNIFIYRRPETLVSQSVSKRIFNNILNNSLPVDSQKYLDASNGSKLTALEALKDGFCPAIPDLYFPA